MVYGYMELLTKTFKIDDIEIKIYKLTQSENGVQKAPLYSAHIQAHGNVGGKPLTAKSKLLKLLDLNEGEEITALGKTVQCTDISYDVEEYQQ